MPRLDLDESQSERFQQQRLNAIKLGSIAVASELTQERGDYDLDANLFNLTSQISDFYHGQTAVDEFRDQYSHMPWHQIPKHAKEQFKHDKQAVTGFNHAVKEVINAGGNKLDFNDLLVFVTHMGQQINRDADQKQFHAMARESLIGMRNEVAFEQILIAADLDYEVGDEDDDAKGADFIINGIPVDVKASQFGVERSRQQARDHGYSNRGVVWSHVDFEDFNGKLTLPFDTVDAKVPAVVQDLAQFVPPTDRYATYH